MIYCNKDESILLFLVPIIKDHELEGLFSLSLVVIGVVVVV